MPQEGDRRDAAPGDGLRVVVVVSFLNEGELLGRLLASFDRQTRRPDVLCLVDDGSTDGSAELAGEFAASRDWVRLLRRPPRPPVRDRLVGAPELVAFQWAVDRLDESWDVVAKMDADLELAPRHVEEVVAALVSDERLGIAGSYLTDVAPDGGRSRARHPVTHVRGATKFYRRRCFEAISPIPPILGWDGADETKARLLGWRVASIELSDGETLHLRPTGSHDGRLRAFRRWGACAYGVGAHPLAVLGGAVLRVPERPRVVGAAAYVLGWAQAAARRMPRAEPEVRAATRREHRARIASAGRRVLRLRRA